jgi:hypothetical protein
MGGGAGWPVLPRAGIAASTKSPGVVDWILFWGDLGFRFHLRALLGISIESGMGGNVIFRIGSSGQPEERANETN